MARNALMAALAVVLCLSALALTGTATAADGCAARLLADWQDGRIDRTYAVPCYRAALESLPEDLQVYSTAQTDLTRALQNRLEAVKPQAGTKENGGGGISPALVLALTCGLFLAVGSIAVRSR
jgi:hypothetical protein